MNERLLARDATQVAAGWKRSSVTPRRESWIA
jgi:hypothetical protein